MHIRSYTRKCPYPVPLAGVFHSQQPSGVCVTLIQKRWSTRGSRGIASDMSNLSSRFGHAPGPLLRSPGSSLSSQRAPTVLLLRLLLEVRELVVDALEDRRHGRRAPRDLA